MPRRLFFMRRRFLTQRRFVPLFWISSGFGAESAARSHPPRQSGDTHTQARLAVVFDPFMPGSPTW
jgi:hypothetical protein